MAKQKSELLTKVGEERPKSPSHLEIGHESNRIDGSFVTITDQVEYVVQDRKMNAVDKFSLIDLEFLAA